MTDEYLDHLYVDYVWINFPKRTLSIQVSDGNIEKIRYQFTEEGAEGFRESVTNVQGAVDTESICYLL